MSRTLGIEFLLDTGFAGFLSLPPDIIQSLQLPWVNEVVAHLAGKVPVRLNVFEASVMRDQQSRVVEVLELEDDPLLGMSLLTPSELRISVEEGGLAEIEPL